MTSSVTITQVDKSSPTPILFCTDDEDLKLLQVELVDAVSDSLCVKEAPEWVVDAVRAFKYHLKRGSYRTVGSFKVFFQNDLKAGSGNREGSSGGSSDTTGINAATSGFSKFTSSTVPQRDA
jgi:hypothetical protein